MKITNTQSPFIGIPNKLKKLTTLIFWSGVLIFSEQTWSSEKKHEFTPSMGLGLNGIAYWGPNFPFLNLMKQAAGGALMPAQNSGKPPLSYDDMESRNLLDENGWPKRLPAGYYWNSIVTADAGYTPSQRGEYTLRYRGNGKLKVITNGNILSQAEGEIRFRLGGTEHYIELQIHSTDPQNQGDYIRDIEIVKSEYITLLEAGLMFNPQWLALIEEMRVLRFMDWQFTNNNLEKSWDKRPTLESNTWGATLERKSQKGVPIEAMVALANHIGADPWFTLPFHADDHYIRQFARYVAQHLDPNLTPYFEYSNEVWNWIFSQTRESANKGSQVLGAMFGDTPEREYYGYRSAQMSDFIRQEFKTFERAAPHITLATQTDDNAYPLQRAVNGAMHYLKPSKRPLNALFDSVAVTWYFGIEPQLQSQVAAWINQHGAERARSMVFEQFLEHKQHFKVANPAHAPNIQKILHNIKIQNDFAQKHGLSTISYEGGTHLLGYEQYNESLADFFIDVNNDDRMGDAYRRIENGWRMIQGATLLNHFVDVSKHTKWGSWGALRHLEDKSARWDFIVEANRRGGNWESRRPDTFKRGKIAFIDDNNRPLHGGNKSDFLIGDNNANTLQGNQGNDGLHGGQGDDQLFGGEGDDTLVPGIGHDQLHGGPGQDTFRFAFPIGNQVNVIHDYEDKDILDFRPLLLNVAETAALERFLKTKQVAEGTEIHINMSGKGNKFTHIITLNNTKNLNLIDKQKQGTLLLH